MGGKTSFPTVLGYGVSRRATLRLGAGAAFLPFASRAAEATRSLSRQLRIAAAKGAAVRLPPGVTAIGGLDLPEGATLIGAPGGSTLKLVGEGPLLTARFVRKIVLESIVLDAADAYIPRERGILDFIDVLDFSIEGCVFRNSTARGVNLNRCGGRFAGNMIKGVRDAGFFLLDGLGVNFDGNRLLHNDDNGAVFWATSAGRYDGSRVRHNLIEDIRNVSGGNGPWGNGVLVFSAGGVQIENNVIRRCAYSAVRNNAGHDVAVIDNNCEMLGERAMYAEFGAKRSIFKNNRIHDAGAGIGVANADRGTDGAVVAGNIITGLRETHPDPDFGPQMMWLTGIVCEKNCDIIGNTVVGPGWIGIGLGGWRENLRAEDNYLDGLDYGIAFATGDGAGNAIIKHNTITASRKAAVGATAGLNFLAGDVAEVGVAHKYPRLLVEDNRTR